MAEPQETQQEKETRWADQRATHDTQQKDYRAARATDKGEKLVGCRSHRDHRCGDCCGYSAVKSDRRAVRCDHTEERGSSFVHGRRQGAMGKNSNGHPRGWPSSLPTYALFASPLHTACKPLHLCQPFRNGAPFSCILRNSGCACK